MHLFTIERPYAALCVLTIRLAATATPAKRLACLRPVTQSPLFGMYLFISQHIHGMIHVCVRYVRCSHTCGVTGLLAAGDGQRRLRGLAACRIQRLARRYIWEATKNRREAAARAEREAQLVAQMEELRIKMQAEINELRVSVIIQNISAWARRGLS